MINFNCIIAIMREEKKKSNFFSVFGKILFKVEKEQK